MKTRILIVILVLAAFAAGEYKSTFQIKEQNIVLDQRGTANGFMSEEVDLLCDNETGQQFIVYRSNGRAVGIAPSERKCK